MSVDVNQAKSSDNQTPKTYNARALVRCEASYLGAALPTKTTQPPGIIHEPLEKICEKENLPTLVNTPKKPVRLYIFHSGIMIEILFGKHNGEFVWYPIQNLYCSAGLQPLKTKHGPLEFRTLDDQSALKSSLKPIFAMVVRETVQRKVLQCHAFAVTRKELAQLLVQATAVAYRDESGWNQPLNGSHFGSLEYGHTLNIADEVHPDSGYSDHEESSLKGEQSPQSSELSIGDNMEQIADNQNIQKPKILGYTMSSRPPIITISKDSPPSIRSYNRSHSNRSSSARSPSNILRIPPQTSPSRTSVPFCDLQSDLQSVHSGDERDSTRSNKCGSVSSGYPLSRDSSLATTQHNIPPVTVMQKTRLPSTSPRHSTTNSDKIHNIKESSHRVPLESFRSMSLSQSTINSQPHTTMVPKVEVINVDGVPRRVIHNEPYYVSSLPREYYNNSGVGQQYREPIYVQYHPEQFMYKGDNYPANEVYVDAKTSQSKERHKSSKDSKKSVQLSTVQLSTVQLSTVQLSTVQLSTVQLSTVQEINQEFQHGVVSSTVSVANGGIVLDHIVHANRFQQGIVGNLVNEIVFEVVRSQ